MTITPAPAFLDFQGHMLTEGRHVFDLTEKLRGQSPQNIDRAMNSIVKNGREAGWECRRLPFDYETNEHGTKLVIMIRSIDGVLVKNLPEDFFPPHGFFERPIETHYHKILP